MFTEEQRRYCRGLKVENMTYSKVAIVVSPEMIKEMELDKHGKATCTLQGDVIYARLFMARKPRMFFSGKAIV